MPRPKGSKAKKKKVPDKMTCVECEKEQDVVKFYKSNSKFFNRIPICKKCLTAKIDYEDMETVYDVFRQMNLPFLIDVWETAERSKTNTLGGYIRMINSLPQYTSLEWEDSYFDDDRDEEMGITKPGKFDANKTDWDYNKLREKWGRSYEEEELYLFEKKYNELRDHYKEKTAMHREALMSYVRYRVKEEMATERGDVKEAKDWGGLAEKQATAAKINPSQMSASDLQDGLTTFGQLVRAVEKAQDVIPILPQFKERPQDKVDFTIWCYVNYIRDLKGLSPCGYQDVYDFYEQRKKEYESKDLLIHQEDVSGGDANG